MNARNPLGLGPCLLWTGPRFPGGYGRITRRAELARYGTPLAHRAEWINAHGPIPDGMCICHRCDEPGCIRLDHLFIATHAENMADKVAKGRARGGHAHTDRCRRGHPFDEENTYVSPAGARSCRECNRARTARRRASTRPVTATGRARSTHCQQGHEFTESNTYISPTSRRRRRTCERARDTRRRAATATPIEAHPDPFQYKGREHVTDPAAPEPISLSRRQPADG